MCDHVPAVPVRFDVPMPRSEFDFVPVLYCKFGQRVKVRVTSSHLTSCFTHWIDGRTRPCYTPVCECLGCKRRYPRLWKGFLGGICHFTRQTVIAMLTPHAVRPFRARLEGKDGGVRGALLTMYHMEGDVARKLRISLEDKPFEGVLPDELDVEAQLKWMWMREAARRDPEDENRFEMIPIPED